MRTVLRDLAIAAAAFWLTIKAGVVVAWVIWRRTVMRPERTVIKVTVPTGGTYLYGPPEN